eukprot:CAMPEP_0171578656 /NCGR_PEP_ID=MMETSP0961-20121227/7983_1 /TAXON_ID=87120 /ORGANISM="Aurantiochytrium limacinum, Strain ATCCMYA-1381" /LENGTH=756 /DNA_ID=CAMNT_0012135005 /DNA_START=918 /DNA_END=3188 /DNA_ORIENTATION=-
MAGSGDGGSGAPLEARMTVCVRTRPLSKTEQDRGERAVVRSFCRDKVVRIHKEARAGAVLRSEMGAQHEYQFDKVFGHEATQEDIYEGTTQPIVLDALRGINCTVFAYGSTGAGKTHSMLGNPEDPGIIPRALVDLFRGIDRLRDDFDVDPRSAEGASKEWSVKLSYLEVYNETIYDLLTHKQRPLQPCEDPNDFQVKVLGLTEVEVTSTEQVLELLESGNKRRRMESTAANQVSSRSHAVLQVRIESTLIEPIPFSGQRRLAPKPKKTVTSSVLSLIDLAGSERAAATQNRGARLREGANINRSLLALANCINALSSGKKSTRVKYRDSKLTHLLKSSLEGNCSLCMLAAINPSNKCYEESHNTLKYANRAKDIKIKQPIAPVRRAGTSMGSEEAERLEELEAENQELRSRLSASQHRHGGSNDSFLNSLNDSNSEGAESDGDASSLQARIAELEVQNNTLTSLASAKLDIPASELRDALTSVVASFMESDNEAMQRLEIASLREQVKVQKAEMARLESFIEEQQNSKQQALETATEQQRNMQLLIEQQQEELRQYQQYYQHHQRQEKQQQRQQQQEQQELEYQQQQAQAAQHQQQQQARGLDRDLPPPPAHLLNSKSLRSKMRRKSFIPTLHGNSNAHVNAGASVASNNGVPLKENRSTTRHSADAVSEDAENMTGTAKKSSKKRVSTDGQAFGDGKVRLKKKREHHVADDAVTPARKKSAEGPVTPPTASPSTRSLRMRVPRFRMRNGSAAKR